MATDNEPLVNQHQKGFAILERINGEYSALLQTTFSTRDDPEAIARWRGWVTAWIREPETLLGDSLAIGQFRAANAGPASTPVGHSIAWGGLSGTMEAKLEALRQIIEKRLLSAGTTTTVVVHGVVGNLNMGTVIGDLRASVSALQQGGQAELARLMDRLVDALTKSRELSEGERNQALELARAMADEIAKSAERRSGTVIETVATRLATIVSKAADLAPIWRAIVAWLSGDQAGGV
jgi:hypothetical protein